MDVKDTTTPDSADLRLTVTGAKTEGEVLAGVNAKLAASKYFKGWEVYKIDAHTDGTFTAWAEPATPAGRWPHPED